MTVPMFAAALLALLIFLVVEEEEVRWLNIFLFSYSILAFLLGVYDLIKTGFSVSGFELFKDPHFLITIKTINSKIFISYFTITLIFFVISLTQAFSKRKSTEKLGCLFTNVFLALFLLPLVINLMYAMILPGMSLILQKDIHGIFILFFPFLLVTAIIKHTIWRDSITK